PRLGDVRGGADPFARPAVGSGYGRAAIGPSAIGTVLAPDTVLAEERPAPGQVRVHGGRDFVRILGMQEALPSSPGARNFPGRESQALFHGPEPFQGARGQIPLVYQIIPAFGRHPHALLGTAQSLFFTLAIGDVEKGAHHAVELAVR